MAISHVKSVTIADFTGTVTAFNSQGSTATVAASALALPSDWNSVHNQYYTVTGNTTQGTTASGTNVVLSGAGRVSVGGTGATIVISAPPAVTLDGYIVPYLDREMLAAQIGNNQIFVQPLNVRQAFQFDRFVAPVIYTATSNQSGSATLSLSIGLYTRNGNSLSLAASTSQTFAVTNSGTVGSYSLVAGLRHLPINWTSTIEADNYWLAIGSRTTTGGAAGMTWSNVVASQINTALSGWWQSAANASNQFVLGLGSFNTTSTALPASMAFAAISGSAAINARPVIFQFASSTT
jgi:hypothetical protein